MWYSLVFTPVTTYVASRRCNCGGMSTHRILPSTYSPVSPSVVLPLWLRGEVRVYFVGYIFCIIDYHICRDIFGRIDIMYCRLPYVSRSALPLRTLVLYIYRPRDTMQYNQQLYTIYSSYREPPCVVWAVSYRPMEGGPPLCLVCPSPCAGPRNRWYIVPSLLNFVRGGVLGDIPYYLSIHDVPSWYSSCCWPGDNHMGTAW
jgi:hypothetical protein